ncbi:hypothetical protein [Isoptericola halotolerans]|uniref:Uncharacterized protein n=1 Tax=Isoptericola halotolerans TaxID=300560 RepID=A0ABX2A4Y7_9MICO|nr:hypothetical protein [Isoptericola halotolerans]
MTTPGAARWTLLFADLEAQLAAEEAAERDGAVAELTRAEQASVPLVDRLRAAQGRPVRIDLCDGEVLAGRLARVATSWFQLDARRAQGGRVQHLVPLAAVVGVTGLGPYATPSSRRTDGLGLGTALRALQRDRARVQVRTTARTLLGRVARVGADHLDVVELDTPAGEVRVVPFAALVRVSEA